MNKESSLQSKQQVNLASQLELLQTLPRVQVQHLLPMSDREALAEFTDQKPSCQDGATPLSSCYTSSCGGLLSLKVEKGKSVAVKAKGSLTWELPTGCRLGLGELSVPNSATCCLRASSAQQIVAGQQQ